MKQRLLATAALAALTAIAQPASAAPNQCAVIGLTPLKQFVTKEQRTCYKKASAAQKAGLTAFTTTRRRTSSRATTQCQIVGVPSLGVYFVQRERRCFTSVKKAEKKGFVPLTVTTPTSLPPTVTPTVIATATPTATPVVTPTPTTPPGSGRSFSFPLSPQTLNVPGSTASGQCNAVLSAAGDRIGITCTQDIASASFTHLVLVDNTEICALPSPGPTFSLDCALTADQAAKIEAGDGLVDVHNAGGAQELAGFLTPRA